MPIRKLCISNRLNEALVETREIYDLEEKILKLDDKCDNSHSPKGKIVSPLQVSFCAKILVSDFAPLLEV